MCLVVVLSVVGAGLPAGSPVDAQQPVVVWHTLGPDAESALARLADAYEQQTGVPAVIEYMPPQVLFESVKTASQEAAGGPDVIITGSDSLVTLLENRLINAQSLGETFFLRELVKSLPGLLAAECGSGGIAECLWPRVSPSLVVEDMEDATLDRAWNWMCSAADWLLPCEDRDWPGTAISWRFNMYLISETWLAENGVDVPFSVQEIDNLRGEYGIDYVWAEETSIPLAGEARAGAVYVMPSDLIDDDPNGLMRAMDSFNQMGYLPVLELGIDGAYVSATATAQGQAADFVRFLGRQFDFKVELASATDNLPAVSPNDLPDLGTEVVRHTLRAVLTLVSYSTVAY